MNRDNDNNNKSNNQNDRRVDDPTAPGYGQPDEPSHQQLAARTEQMVDVLPNVHHLTASDGFYTGQIVNRGSMNVQLDTPASVFNRDSRSRQTEFRRIGTGMGVFNNESPNETNFAQLSSADNHMTMAASFQPRGEQHAASTALESKLTKMARKQDRIHKTFTVESHGAVRDPTRTFKADPFRIDKHHRLMGKKGSKKASDTAPLVGKCSNCGQFDHTIVDCWGPTDDFGLINRCPCNGLNHRADQCDKIRTWPNVLKFQIFYVKRIGLPPFKYHESWIYLIAHDPQITSLHNIVKHFLKNACKNADPSLTWRSNPLTMQFAMQTWNHAKPWRFHDYSKPRERWCNLPDSAYIAEDWFHRATNEMLLNPLQQSFINRQSTMDLPGMETTWDMLQRARAIGENENFDVFKQNMQNWLAFYNNVDDMTSQHMEFIYQKLTESSVEDLQTLSRCTMEQADKEFLGDFDAAAKARHLPAKPGIGVPRVPQYKPETWPMYVDREAYFIQPNGAPAQQPSRAGANDPEGDSAMLATGARELLPLQVAKRDFQRRQWTMSFGSRF